MLNSVIRIIAVLVFSAAFLVSCNDNGNGRSIEASGIIEAIEIKVPCKADGQIERVLVQEGDRVLAGDTILQVDSEILIYQLRSAEAGVDAAAANLQLMKKGAREEDVRSAQEGVNSAEANYQTVMSDLERARNLFKSGSSSEKNIEDLENRLTIAEAQLQTAKEQLKKVGSIFRVEEIKSAEANFRQASANRDLILKRISDCYVKAPVDGIVTSLPIYAGEMAGMGRTAAKIANLDKVEMFIYVTEPELGLIITGQSVSIFVDSHPGRKFSGEVMYISPEAEFTPKNIQTKEDRVKLVYGIKVGINNKEGILKSGMPADAEIIP